MAHRLKRGNDRAVDRVVQRGFHIEANGIYLRGCRRKRVAYLRVDGGGFLIDFVEVVTDVIGFFLLNIAVSRALIADARIAGEPFPFTQQRLPLPFERI